MQFGMIRKRLFKEVPLCKITPQKLLFRILRAETAALAAVVLAQQGMEKFADFSAR